MMSKRKSLARLALERTQECHKSAENTPAAGATVVNYSHLRPLGGAAAERSGELPAPVGPSSADAENGVASDQSGMVMRRLQRSSAARVPREHVVSSRHSYPAALTSGGGAGEGLQIGWLSPPPASPVHTPHSSPKHRRSKVQAVLDRAQQIPKATRQSPAKAGRSTIHPKSQVESTRARCEIPSQESTSVAPSMTQRQTHLKPGGCAKVLLPDGSLLSAADNPPKHSCPVSCIRAEFQVGAADGSDHLAESNKMGSDVRLRSDGKLPTVSSSPATPAGSGAPSVTFALKPPPTSSAASSPAVRSGAAADASPTLYQPVVSCTIEAAPVGIDIRHPSAVPATLMTPRRASMSHAHSTNDLPTSPEKPCVDVDMSPPTNGSSWSSPLSTGQRARSFPAGLAGSLETLSSLSETSVGSPLSNLSVQKARSRGYLVNTTGSALLLGGEELSACLPQRKLHLLVGTWNMNAKESPASLDDLVLPDVLAFVPDMVVLGTQESHADYRGLLVRLQSTLGPSHVLFHAASLGTLHICVFLRRDLIWYCSVPEEASYSIRQPTAIKTKGCVAVGFQFFGTTFLFLTCHLTAHLEKQNQRIDDVRRICAALDIPQNIPSRSQSRDVTERYDNVLWFGDLNFRLSQTRPRVIDTIVESSAAVSQLYLTSLLQWDQLNHAKHKGRAFEGFGEGEITFLPTYKYDPGTNTFDTSAKQRIPAYTDRILFKSRRDAVRCLKYDSVHGFNTSDHKPVWGLYQCDVRPSMDNIPLAAGKFDRSVYLEGLRRRARHLPGSGRQDGRACTLQ